MTLRISRLAFATFATPDTSQLGDYYVSVLGLAESARQGAAIHLASRQGETCLVLEPGEASACTGLGFACDPAIPLADVARWLGTQGIESQIRSDAMAGRPASLRFRDFKGTVIDLFHAPPPAGNGAPRVAPIAPAKLGHVAFYVADIGRAVAFYRDILGFRISDWMEDFFVFMRCGPEHHTCNFISSANRGMHHMAFELSDWGEVRTACDWLARHKIKVTWGPGRHGPGHNIFLYHRNPQGQLVELFTELDTMSDEGSGVFDPKPWHVDTPQRPKVWRAAEAANLWGDGPPPGHRS
ncbi:MAG: VOC family protein [Pseudomonadota bacterium]